MMQRGSRGGGAGAPPTKEDAAAAVLTRFVRRCGVQRALGESAGGALLAQVLGGTKKKSGWGKLLRRSPFKTKKRKEKEAARAAAEATAHRAALAAEAQAQAARAAKAEAETAQARAARVAEAEAEMAREAAREAACEAEARCRAEAAEADARIKAKARQSATANAVSSTVLSQRAARVGDAELDLLKRSLLAAAYTQHGVDLAALFARYDADGSGALDTAELGPHVQKMLPGVLSDRQVRRMVSAIDADGDGAVSLAEFVAFVNSRRRPARSSRAMAVPPAVHVLAPPISQDSTRVFTGPPASDAELVLLKHSLLDASLKQHGVELPALLARLDAAPLQLLELRAVVQQQLPGVLSDRYVSRLLKPLFPESGGPITLAAFSAYVRSAPPKTAPPRPPTPPRGSSPKHEQLYKQARE